MWSSCRTYCSNGRCEQGDRGEGEDYVADQIYSVGPAERDVIRTKPPHA